MLINSPDCSTCLFSRAANMVGVGCVGGDFSQSDPDERFPETPHWQHRRQIYRSFLYIKIDVLQYEKQVD